MSILINKRLESEQITKVIISFKIKLCFFHTATAESANYFSPDADKHSQYRMFV